MQLTYADSMAVGFPGMLADTGFKHVDSMTGIEQIGPGLALVKVEGKDKQVRLPIADTVVITDDAGTYTAGNYIVTLRGDTITVAYDTDREKINDSRSA